VGEAKIKKAENIMDKQIKDYETCGVCGYDHSYDFPVLSEEQLLEAEAQHLEFEYQCLNDFDYPGP
jgi:hypothetical protein